MAVSRAYKILWGTGIVLVILPHLYLGLLSDYKICGDSECESPMSRVQAIRDHHGKDCRFLSFKRGDTIFVYHKLTGKREDLWAGTIDKQFGYFPKDAVQEEELHAAMETVVETQKSDFFCVDEFGYLIDSTHLDSNNDDDDDGKIQNQESETTQTHANTDDTNADPSVPAQEVDGTSTEEDKHTGDTAARTQEEVQEVPVDLNEKGGSASSSWLGSSVTGWLGLAKEEDNLSEEEKKEDRKETQGEASFASSVTGWLGLGGEENPKDAEKSREEDRETDDSFTSTMTGWLGFGEEKKTEQAAEKEQDDEEVEPGERFRSRRMSLDLEGSQLHEEEKEEMGTLGWLGNRLSGTLGFGLTNQESGHETATEKEAEEIIQKEDEEPTSRSWFDVGIGDILGYGEDESDESTGSGLKGTQEDETLVTEEVRTETSNDSKVEETLKDQNAHLETVLVPGSTEPVDSDSVGASDSSEDSDFPEDAASKVEQKDISQEEKSQAVGGLSSVLENFFQKGSKDKEEENVLDYDKKDENEEGKSAEMEGDDHQTPQSIENEDKDSYRDLGEGEINTVTDTDQDSLTQSDLNSVDLNSMEGSVAEVQEAKTEDVVEEKAENQKQTDNTEESNMTPVKTHARSDDHEDDGNKAETEISASHSDDSEQTQVSGGTEERSAGSPSFLLLASSEEGNEPISKEDDTLTAHTEGTSVDNSDSETQQGELRQEGGFHPFNGNSEEFGSSDSTNRSLEIMSENASEENRERTTQMENNADEESVSPHEQQEAAQSDSDAQKLKEDVQETEKGDKNNKKYPFHESGQVEESKEEKKQEETEELKEEEKKQEVKELKEEEKQEEVEELKEDKEQDGTEEFKKEEMQEEVEELAEKEKQEEVNKEDNKGEVVEEKEDEKQVELKVEEIKKEGKQVEDLKEEKEQDEKEVLKKEEGQGVVEELAEGEKEEEIKENNKEEVMELKEEEKQGEEEEKRGMEGIKEEENQEEVEVLKEDEKQEKVEGLKEDEKQQQLGDIREDREQEVEEIKEENNQEEVMELKEEEKQVEEGEKKEEEVEELKEDKKQEEMEELKENEQQQQTEELNEEKQEEVRESHEEGNLGEEEEKRNEMEGITEEKEQEEVEELKEEKQEKVEELDEEENMEELKQVEEVQEEEKKEGGEEQVQSSNSEEEMENISRPESESNQKETQDEDSLEWVLSENIRHPQVEEVKKEEENPKTEQAEEVKDELEEENVEDKRKDKEEKGSQDVFVRDADGNNSVNRLGSVDEGAIEVGQQSERITEKDRKEKRNDDDKADEGIEKQGERTNLNATGNEDINSNNANGISDLNALGVTQTGEIQYLDDLLFSGINSQTGHPNEPSAEDKEDEQLYSSEAKNTDDNVLHQGGETQPRGTETSSNGISTEEEAEHSDHKIDPGEDTDGEQREVKVRYNDVNEDADMQVTINGGNTVGSEFEFEGGVGISSSDPVGTQAVMSEQTIPHPAASSLLSDGHNKGIADTEGGGAFGLFKNAFGYFSSTSATETKESTETTPSLDSNTGETSNAEASLTPELDSTVDSSQVYLPDVHVDSPITLAQQQLQPSPTQTHPHPSSLPPNAGSPLKTKSLSKHYKNLLGYMSEDEAAVLMELFGRHKLQFLDYILGSSETMMDDRDESILLDVERLLHHHRETLVAPKVSLADAPQEDKDKTRTLIALEKLEMLLAKVREAFNTGRSNISNTNQAEASCVGESCSNGSKDRGTEEESGKVGDSSEGLDADTPGDEWMGADKEKEGRQSGSTGKHRITEESSPHSQPRPPQSLEGVMKQILDFVNQIAEDSTTHVHAASERLKWLTVQVVSSLPDDIRPGPDLYGVPWEPVIMACLVGLVTVLLFTCRCYSSIKSRMYRSKERWMAEQIAQLLDEKCKVLETLSRCQQEHDDLENSLRDSGVLAQTEKTEHLEVKARQLGHAKKELERDLEQLKDQLEQQREHRVEQERRIALLEESMKTSEEDIKDLQSQEEQAQTTLKVYSMNSDRLQRNLETAGEENALLHESNTQLRQQVEGWAERVSELEAEMSRCEVTHSAMMQDVANKDERIMSLTDRLLRMKAWDSDLEEEGGEEGGEREASNGTAGRGEENGRGDRMDTQGHLQKVQKLIYAAKLNADLKSVDEDKDRVFAKLNDEVKAKEDLQESIKELDNEKLSLQSDTEHYSDQVQRLQQKLQIMTEMYQENELKLHRLLTVEEKERMQKEEKLNKADKNIALAMEELNNYRQRAEDMEEELNKTKQSYQTQISAHEKKAHNNWLAARAAERELADIRRENALFRQKLTDTQFKLDALDKDPYALDSLARPLPFRAERSPYGPSPLGRPASETRAFLSPPTLMDGPPARLSPRVPRGGPVEPPGGQGEMERSGGPHSDSGSISPTWERDRRGPPPGPPGPLGPPGYMFPEPGGPMYRRPPPPPGALGHLPPPGSLPPGPLYPRGLPPGPPHPADMDGTYRENSLGPGDLEHRDPGPGDRRTPPEADPRMGGAPLPGPPMGPMDGPFPRRAPYGPPPPDFYPPRGPGGPPMMPMWAPPPPGMMFPPRFPPGGPPAPHPHHAPPMRPPLLDGLPPRSMGPPPPQHSLPSPPHSQSPEEHTPSPEDAI